MNIYIYIYNIYIYNDIELKIIRLALRKNYPYVDNLIKCKGADVLGLTKTDSDIKGCFWLEILDRIGVYPYLGLLV